MNRTSGTIMVTGASGVVGRNLIAALDAARRPVVAVGREAGRADATTDWRQQLAGLHSVVHLAGLHVGDATAFERDVEMTLNLARQAAAAGVERFVFLSSIKVNGERTSKGRAFSETDRPDPIGAYARAKLTIEQALAQVALPVTVVRAPLIYGPGARANFRRLMQAVERGWPLPLASVENRRSLLAVGNLCDFVMRVLDDERTAGETYVLADGEDVSTAELLRRLARSRNRSARLVPVPSLLVEGGLRIAGLGSVADRLLGDLRVDIGKARRLGWEPPLTLDAGLASVWRQPGDSVR